MDSYMILYMRVIACNCHGLYIHVLFQLPRKTRAHADIQNGICPVGLTTSSVEIEDTSEMGVAFRHIWTYMDE